MCGKYQQNLSASCWWICTERITHKTTDNNKQSPLFIICWDRNKTLLYFIFIFYIVYIYYSLSLCIKIGTDISCLETGVNDLKLKCRIGHKSLLIIIFSKKTHFDGSFRLSNTSYNCDWFTVAEAIYSSVSGRWHYEVTATMGILSLSQVYRPLSPHLQCTRKLSVN